MYSVKIRENIYLCLQIQLKIDEKKEKYALIGHYAVTSPYIV